MMFTSTEYSTTSTTADYPTLDELLAIVRDVRGTDWAKKSKRDFEAAMARENGTLFWWWDRGGREVLVVADSVLGKLKAECGPKESSSAAVCRSMFGLNDIPVYRLIDAIAQGFIPPELKGRS